MINNHTGRVGDSLHALVASVGGYDNMTNEELATLAKAGDRQAMAQLWEQNKGLLFTLFRKLAGRAGARMASMGVTWEDVEQCFYLAVVDAVALYEPERGMSFASFLAYPVKSQFFELVGWRTERQKHDPLGQCSSLDEPIDAEDGKQTRGDFVPDPEAAQPFEDAEKQLFTEQLHAALEECLGTLDARQAEAVRCRYFSGLTLAETGTRLGCNAERVRQLENKGLRKLRYPQNTRRLKQFRDEIISTQAYHGTSLGAWKYGGSVEERTVIYLENSGL